MASVLRGDDRLQVFVQGKGKERYSCELMVCQDLRAALPPGKMQRAEVCPILVGNGDLADDSQGLDVPKVAVAFSHMPSPTAAASTAGWSVARCCYSPTGICRSVG